MMLRPWKFPEYPYRAIDQDGCDYYHRHKPKRLDEEEWIADLRGWNQNKCLEYGGKVSSDWAKEWEESLQTREDYLKIKIKSMNIGDSVELVYRGEKVQGVITEIASTYYVVTDSLGKETYVEI